MRDREKEGVLGGGAVEVSGGAGHAVQLGVVSAPQRRERRMMKV